LKQTVARIISNEKVTYNTHLIWLDAIEIASSAQPGQFVSIRCENLLLRRPFSINQVNSTRIAILIKIIGEGTRWLASQRKGQRLDILGPLGHGFTIEPSAKNLLLVSGGIGIAPLIFLAQRAYQQHSITLIYGASTSTELCPFSAPQTNMPKNFIPSPGETRIILVTEDGSAGEKGTATSILSPFINWADQIFACGPAAMYLAMSNIPIDGLKRSTCQVSLETIMGCGIGACYGCTINTRKGPKRICHDGPVFQMGDILWQEMKI
jgi:dihydroorotate dehydrogenase electron transfer subunit